jgi:very-short-patch-repair endonuclease
VIAAPGANCTACIAASTRSAIPSWPPAGAGWPRSWLPARTASSATQRRDVPSLEALARAHTGHRGAAKLLATLGAHEAGTTLTRSELEELFLALCRKHGLPKPKVNARVVGPEVDFAFPDHRLLVETDSWRWHRTREAFERDRHRDALHTRAGYRTLRFTHLQLTQEPHTVAATLATALGP